MPKRNVVSWTSMLFGLVGVWRIHEAWSLLNAMPEKNIVSWNLMTAGYAKNSRMVEARVLFENSSCFSFV
ncbi:hypothetical protein FEM48_Zijuj09G0159300 [Ziziphus jujuba var. spinosa]|uniref:Pentatricopeptide repeat-containing protein n=1 Tax=Ziziphus jujuba var. spinosa TaxID=714518 RepID=A0A978UTX4_ZIZJJ|nr:hypothetical protein FEM48_Zijuj09G0159300 [Ziziphus jujuba var. spinosa]